MGVVFFTSECDGPIAAGAAKLCDTVSCKKASSNYFKHFPPEDIQFVVRQLHTVIHFPEVRVRRQVS